MKLYKIHTCDYVSFYYGSVDNTQNKYKPRAKHKVFVGIELGHLLSKLQLVSDARLNKKK